MTDHHATQPNDQTPKEAPRGPRPPHAFDLREVLRKSRAEDLGHLAPHSF